MSKARVYARNLAVNWFGHGASMVVLFFLSPFVVHTLGTLEYGIWSVLTVLTGYMGITDLGVRASVGRYITLYIGQDNHDRVGETIRTGLGFFSILGVVILVIAVCMGWIFPAAFSSVPAQYYHIVRILLPLMAANIWLAAFSGVFHSVLTSHDRFDLRRGIDLVVLAIRTSGVVLTLRWGYGLIGLAVVSVMCRVIETIISWLVARKVYPRLQVWPFMLSRPRIRELLGYGIAAFIYSIGIKLIGQTDLIIVGAFISVSASGVYSVGAMLIYYSSSFIGIIGGTFFPPVQRAVARGEMGPARWLFLRQVRLSLIFGLPIYMGFIIFAKPFITLWMLSPEFPESAVEQAAMVMGVLATSKLLYIFTVGSNELLAAMGHVRFTAGIVLTEAFLNLLLSLLFVLVFGWGLFGVAAGTVVSRLLVRTFTFPWYACRKAGLKWTSFLMRIGGTGALSAVLFLGWCLIVRQMFPVDSWRDFWAQVTMAMIGYLPIAIWVLMPTEDRKRIWNHLCPSFDKQAGS